MTQIQSEVIVTKLVWMSLVEKRKCKTIIVKATEKIKMLVFKIKIH